MPPRPDCARAGGPRWSPTFAFPDAKANAHAATFHIAIEHAGLRVLSRASARKRCQFVARRVGDLCPPAG